ncbi:CDGSH iron-sulfur domain-containing protein [Leptothoe spongobia]|uniref:CDGSH iron-sulfur domain-containing protein n=1 Tax=Leptothoe spongobia TAU-MAC 1115 TaxID=1967444 RepID=A0A947GPF2_9CYAN|nr:CDGSH iron-sulfur domain-containing protein [Leptothoe spongobia]MBT9316526.1 CDGSH iron-sulfur domain-containing protein [Leptothoe spongobia TAU-MAC 1115]
MTQQPSPQVLTLEAGTHWLCTCGQSKKSPYCDGSHQGTSFQPLALELEAPKQVEISA